MSLMQYTTATGVSRRLVTPMNVIPINEAEAMVAPLFDQGLTDFHAFTAVNAAFIPSWDCALLKSCERRFALRWRGDLALDGYDRLRLFINFPPWIRMSGTAVVNAERRTVFHDVPGEGLPCEPTSEPLTGRVTELELHFAVDRDAEALISFYWIGLVNSEREALLEAMRPKYNADWPGLLNPGGNAGIRQPWLVNGAGMDRVKARAARCPALVEELRCAAAQWEGYAPEPHIREFYPCIEHLYRYVRVRDRQRPDWNPPIRLLALAGWLCDRPDWSRLAARLMLAAAHTPHWFEGPQGCTPGSDWHHVCFTESHVLGALAFALQFTGDLLTPAATGMILDRMEEAWRLVNRKCEEPGYRWYMNQGIVFNAERMVGAAALHAHGRAGCAAALEQAYRDHTTVVNHYLGEDGHCTEGPHYFTYSFDSSIPAWMAYATFTGKPLSAIVPERMARSTAYLDAVSCTSGRMMPINATGDECWPLSLVAFMAAHCGWRRGLEILRNVRGPQSRDMNKGDQLALFLLPEEGDWQTVRADGESGSRVLDACLGSGLLALEFPGGKLLFTCERPATGHCHHDRGGIVLEADGELLLPDPGTRNYADVRSAFMKNPDWHNLAHPIGLTPRVHDTIPPNPDMPRASVEWTAPMRFAGNLAPIYGPEVLVGRREGDLTGRTLTLRDIWRFTQARAVEITFQSYQPWQVADASASVGRLRITWTGTACEVTQLDDRCDSQARQVFTLRLRTAPDIETAVTSVIAF